MGRSLAQASRQRRAAGRRRADIRKQPLRRLLTQDPASDRRAASGSGGGTGPFPEGDPLAVPEDVGEEARRLGEVGRSLLAQLLGETLLLLP